MRKLKRSVAHAKMQKAGIIKVNRKDKSFKNDKSFFAKNWKKYI